jgi:hypothetical protein
MHPRSSALSSRASAILADPLARRLCWHTCWVLQAIAAENPSVRPEDAVPVLRLAMVAIEDAVIELEAAA